MLGFVYGGNEFLRVMNKNTIKRLNNFSVLDTSSRGRLHYTRVKVSVHVIFHFENAYIQI